MMAEVFMKSDFILFDGHIIKRDAILYANLSLDKFEIVITFINHDTLIRKYDTSLLAFDAMKRLTLLLTKLPYVLEKPSV